MYSGKNYAIINKKIYFIKEEKMGYIQIKSSIALDILCFIQKRLLNDTKWMNGKQIEEIKNINTLLPNDFNVTV